MTESNAGQDHATTLGTEGAAYGSEAMERLVAEELRAARDGGRQLDRMGAIKKLATEGKVQTYQDTHDFEQELQASIAPEQRGNPEQAPTSGRLSGRTLVEARALQVATQQAQRTGARTTGTVVRLSEEDAREQRIKRFTDQGYARWDAERRVAWQDQQARRQGR
jgi:hypothetical protein